MLVGEILCRGNPPHPPVYSARVPGLSRRVGRQGSGTCTTRSSTSASWTAQIQVASWLVSAVAPLAWQFDTSMGRGRAAHSR